jgi:uncharacterized protein (TIGR01777 family)
MRVTITGASGLIGSALTLALTGRGDSVVGVSRTPERQKGDAVTWVGWDAIGSISLSSDAIVHLAGADIAAKRWTDARKRELWDSRVATAVQVVQAIEASEPKPAVLVSASAVGYYGSRGAEELTETSAPGADFLAELCQAWEAEVQKSGIRSVSLRNGVVLSAKGGALKRLLMPFKLGLGGTIGSGDQYMSWIHVDDLIRMILFVIDSDVTSGAFNSTSPAPVTNREFSKALGSVLGRPVVLRVPNLLLRLRFGEGASALVSGQRALPRRAQELGFSFQHPNVDEALSTLLKPGH